MLLLQYFNELTLQPENAQKLKGLILELAVRGKLTQQWRAENPNTPSAKGLLDQIKAEKKRLITAKKIRKEKPLPPIKAEEIPFELSDGWVWCRLGEVFEIGSSKRIFKSDYIKDGIPFYRSKEIGQLGRGEEVTTELYIDKQKYSTIISKYGKPNKGDILIACIGGSIGNTWLVDKRNFYYKDGNLVLIKKSDNVISKLLLLLC